MHKLFEIPSITLFLCAFCAFLWLKKPRNLRNPWLINDLRLFMTLYTCRETFTDVMSALQIKLFMQNKAKFRKVKLNVNKVLTKDYDKKGTWSCGKNKANTKPIQSQFKPNTKPIQSQYKPKTKPNKPNFRANICCWP